MPSRGSRWTGVGDVSRVNTSEGGIWDSVDRGRGAGNYVYIIHTGGGWNSGGHGGLRSGVLGFLPFFVVGIVVLFLLFLCLFRGVFPWFW